MAGNTAINKIINPKEDNFLYFVKRPNTTRDPMMSDGVAQAMADKIIKEAQEHRKNRQEEE